ncbi:unnamed protein product, partial [Amoebophrya sp. A120]|eukprot:GSA120T00021364001.1
MAPTTPAPSPPAKFSFFVDRGGTFTDFLILNHKDNSLDTLKLLSVDPKNYDDAPIEGIRRTLDTHPDSELRGKLPRGKKIPPRYVNSIRMGTTVATNALLEKEGARVLYITTKGHEDMLKIGNQSRPDIFDLEVKTHGMLYENVVGVDERVVVGRDSVDCAKKRMSETSLARRRGAVEEVKAEKSTAASTVVSEDISAPAESLSSSSEKQLPIFVEKALPLDLEDGDHRKLELQKELESKISALMSSGREGVENIESSQKSRAEIENDEDAGTTENNTTTTRIRNKDKSPARAASTSTPARPTSIAINLLHSYLYPKHEKRLAAYLKKNLKQKFISTSSQLCPMKKAVPRGFTTCVDAYLTPKILEYVEQFCDGFDKQNGHEFREFYEKKLLFMQSDGGLTNIDNFTGFRAIVSGPAGGCVGFSRTTPRFQFRRDSDHDGDEEPQKTQDDVLLKKEKSAPPLENNRRLYLPIIGFDMGGTSTDVSRFDPNNGENNFDQVLETTIAGYTIQAPQLDINTVAAG